MTSFGPDHKPLHGSQKEQIKARGIRIAEIDRYEKYILGELKFDIEDHINLDHICIALLESKSRGYIQDINTVQSIKRIARGGEASCYHAALKGEEKNADLLIRVAGLFDPSLARRNQKEVASDTPYVQTFLFGNDNPVSYTHLTLPTNREV